MFRLIHNSGTAATTGIKRKGHRQFWRNPALDAVIEGPVLNQAARILWPVLQQLGLSKCRYVDIGAAVSGLRSVVNESAVVRRIGPIILGSVNSHPLGVSVGERPLFECGVIVDPLYADRNSSSAVSVVRGRIGIETALLDAAPNSVKFSSVERRFNLLNSTTRIIEAFNRTEGLILGAVQAARKHLGAVFARLVNYGHEPIVSVAGHFGNSLLVPIFTGALSSCESTTKSNPDLCAWVFSRSFQ